MSKHYSKAAVGSALMHFIFGKALNAAISLTTLVVLVRWVSTEDYGVYVALLAVQSTLLALSSLGIDATAERFIPEFRTSLADDEVTSLLRLSIGLRFATLLILTLLVWHAAEPITALVGLGSYIKIFKLWILVIAIAGLFSFALLLLEVNLLQRHAQRCMSIYVIAKLMLLSLSHKYVGINLSVLVGIELVANSLAAILAICIIPQLFSRWEVVTGWKLILKNRSRIKRFAAFNYLAQVIFHLFNADLMKMMVTRLLGIINSARYGVVYNLVETVQRYLPAVLLVRLIKPVFVSRYTRSKNFAELNEMSRIILKLNLLVLSPLIALSIIYAGDVLLLVSKGKYSDGHWLLVAVLCLLVPASHQLVLSILASTLEKNAMQLYAGAASVVAFPCAYMLIPIFGTFGAVIASSISALVYNIAATAYLRLAGYDYVPDVRGFIIFLAAGTAFFIVVMGAQHLFFGIQGFMFAVLCGGIVYIIIIRAFSAFSRSERALLNSLLPKPVFVF